jgi:hypothetical protein
MNAKFGWSMSHDIFERSIFAGFGIATDIVKVFALAFAAFAWERARYAKAAACLIIWGATVAYSGAAALGFAALARDTVVASRTSDVDDYQAASSERKRLMAQMEQARANPLFAESYGCTEYNKATTKTVERKKAELCHLYWRADLALAEIKPQIKAATLTQADPQTAIMAKVFGLQKETAAIGLALFLALVAEIVSSLGVWTFSRSTRRPGRREAIDIPARPKLVVSN